MGAALTLIMPYYDNPTMLGRHYEEWSKWPPEIVSKLNVIIVDDGSPNEPAIGVPYRPNFVRIYRVLEDRPWHQHGARNLGAHVAPEGWLLLTDMDHMLERAEFERLVGLLPVLAADSSYMFERIEADSRKPTITANGFPKPHPNSFLMTRELYWQVGGYDEDFCGLYGTDSFFRSRLPNLRTLSIPLVRYWRALVADASTRTLPRKEGRDPDAKKKVMDKKRRQGRLNVIRTLNFPWEQLC